MKKFILVCFIIFLAGIGCTKVAPLCGCSPIQGPELILVIKDSAGHDLLSDKNMGAYAKNDIQLFKKDVNGNAVQFNIYVRPPFSYGNDNFGFNTLYTAGISSIKDSGETVYLKLGNEPVYELKFQFNNTQPQIDKVFINNNEAEKDTGPVAKYANIFYLTK